MSTRELLIPALRQYMHNDGERLVHGYGLIETQKVVKGLLDRIAQLESQSTVMKMLLKSVTATEFEGIQCKDIEGAGNWFDGRDYIINQ